MRLKVNTKDQLEAKPRIKPTVKATITSVTHILESLCITESLTIESTHAEDEFTFYCFKMIEVLNLEDQAAIPTDLL